MFTRGKILSLLHCCLRTTGYDNRCYCPRGFVSDIAIFVLKRDVKLQLTNSPHGSGAPLSPFSPLVHSLPHLLLFFTFSNFPFFIRFTYFLLLSIPSLFSTRVVPLCFQAGGRRRQPNLGLVGCVYFMLSVSLS